MVEWPPRQTSAASRWQIPSSNKRAQAKALCERDRALMAKESGPGSCGSLKWRCQLRAHTHTSQRAYVEALESYRINIWFHSNSPLFIKRKELLTIYNSLKHHLLFKKIMLHCSMWSQKMQIQQEDPRNQTSNLHCQGSRISWTAAAPNDNVIKAWSMDAEEVQINGLFGVYSCTNVRKESTSIEK